MKKILAFQADPLENLKKNQDNSLFFASYLIKENYSIFFYQAKDLTYRSDTGVEATGFFLEVEDLGQELSYCKISDLTTISLEEVRAVFIRQNPPFDLHYLLSTQILSLLPETVLVLNKPQVLRDHSEKTLPYFLAQALQDFSFIPPSILSSNPKDLLQFLSQEKEVILKPLYDFGGTEVMKVTKKEEVLNYLQKQKATIIAEKFLPEVYQGDKRLFVYDRQILGALVRKPAVGSYLTNTSRGASCSLVEISSSERLFFDKIVQVLPEGLFFAGLDFIGSYLTEVNITSPGLLYIFKLLAGEAALEPFWKHLCKTLAE